MEPKKIGILEMLLCAALWSIGGLFIKLLPWNGFVVASLRSLVAGLTMFCYIKLKKYHVILNKKTLLTGFFTGLVYLCFTCANKLTTSANAIVLQFMSPVFIVVFSALLYKKAPRKKDIIVILAVLAGLVFFAMDGLKAGHLFGDLVAVLAGLFMALMFILVGESPIQERFSGILLGQLTTFILGLPFVFTTHPVFSGQTILYLMVLGVVQLGIAYCLYVEASKTCPPLACCLLGVVEPLLNPVWVLLFYGEKPGTLALVGCAAIIISVTWWLVSDSRKAE
ncbi:MAG: DMT family transporter [Oscillospiraceae bacterium]|nr:DMT family transporter [Oscillospiraceae bacterium]